MTITEATRIGVDVERLSSEVGEFGALNHWHPLVTACDLQKDARGKLRTINPGTPNEQVERLQWEDTARHCYGYTLEHTSMPVRGFAGVFRLERLAEQATRVTWSVQFELTAEGDERTVDAVRQFLHSGIESLNAKYRPWSLGESRGVQRDIAEADKKDRTGSESEPVRNTPPAGPWNDTSSD
jgi:Polyketide cyclase / dehydrase and lipid transport